MSDPFVAEIRIFAGNFAPTGWAFCDGQILPISQNIALFSLLGTTYGGDGRSTFALPDLRGRAPMHLGQGPGLSNRALGELAGSDTVSLLPAEAPVHTHGLRANGGAADLAGPAATEVLAGSTGGLAYQQSTAGLVALSPKAVASSGGGLPHNNMQPYLVLSFIIALQGVFPSRS